MRIYKGVQTVITLSAFASCLWAFQIRAQNPGAAVAVMGERMATSEARIAALQSWTERFENRMSMMEIRLYGLIGAFGAVNTWLAQRRRKEDSDSE